MIKIYDKATDTLQTEISDFTSFEVNEEINGEYTIDFTTPKASGKTEHIDSANYIELDGQYFVISSYTQTMDNSGGIYYDVFAEHKSYELTDDTLEFFTETGTPTEILTALLTDTDFTVGTVEFTEQETISITEPTNKREILKLLVSTLDGELSYDGHSISIVTEIGDPNGIEFTIDKNIKGISVETELIDGVEEAFVDIDFVELRDSVEYQDLEGVEELALGDTVTIIVPDMGVNTQQRVMSYQYNPIKRRTSRVEIQNAKIDIIDDIYRIQTESLQKEEVYNGVRIGPENGIEVIKSDYNSRIVLNAMDGIKLQQGDGVEGTTWTDVLYFDIDNQEYVFNGRITVDGSVATEGYVDQAEIDAVSTANGYTDAEVAPLNTSINTLSDGLDEFSSDLKITLAEANSLKSMLKQVESESTELIAKGTDLGLTTKVDNYNNALNTLSSTLSNFIDQSNYPIDITTTQRTDIDTQFDNVQNAKSDLISQANTQVESNAISTANAHTDTELTNLSDSLGSLAFDDAVELAKLGTTVIDGGYIATGLVDASRIDTGELNASRIAATNLSAISSDLGSITAGSININDTFIVDSSGNVTANSISLSLDSNDISGLGDVASLDSISGTYIDDNSITTNKIAANAITTNEINTSGLVISDLSGDLGTISAGTIYGVNGNFEGHLSGHDVIVANNDTNEGSLNIRLGSSNYVKIAGEETTGGDTTLLLSKATNPSSTTLDYIDRIDIYSQETYIYNMTKLQTGVVDNLTVNTTVDFSSANVSGITASFA